MADASGSELRPTQLTEPDDRSTRVLIALRPDSQPRDAVEFAAWLGRTAHVTVRAVTTFVRPWPATSLKKMGGKYGKWFSREAKAARRRVEEALNEAGVPGEMWDDKVAVFADGPSEHALITAAAEDFDADVIALDSDATAPKGRFSVSSTADALLHSSPRPVCLSPRKVKLSKKGVRRVNFAFLEGEFDPEDPALLRSAGRARAWGVPLRVLAFSPTGISDTPLEDSLDLSRELSADWREHSLAMLDRVRDRIAEAMPDLELESSVATGNGWGGAVDALKWKKGDLLCLASNPLGPFERVFVGSATSAFLPHVGVPVVIFPMRRS
ncbi:universal stress protein [Corynebacterium frankenforstense]